MSIINPIQGKFRVSQDFGNKYMITDPKNPLYIKGAEDYYARYKLLGHDGLDELPVDEKGNLRSRADVVAPFTGEIQETQFLPDYGDYIKIEDDEQGSILAHLSKILVNPGDKVVKGQVIGKTGNTGKSTGEHLHWGYYRIPRNRANGFDGYIDQHPFLPGLPTYADGVKETTPAAEVKENTYEGFNLDTMPDESKKLCIDAWKKLSEGKLVDKAKLDEAVASLEQYKGYKSEAEHLAEQVRNLTDANSQSIKLATEALKVEIEEKDKQIKELTVKANDLASKVAKPNLPNLPGVSIEEYNQLSNLVTELRGQVKTFQDKYEICQTDYQSFRDRTEAERKASQSEKVDVISSQEASKLRAENRQLAETNQGLLLELHQAQEGRVKAEAEVVETKQQLLLKDQEDFTAIKAYIQKLEGEKRRGLLNFFRLLISDTYSLFTKKSVTNS